MPTNAVDKQQRSVFVAASVLVLAVTPSFVEVVNSWDNKPNTRPLLVAWYVFAAVVTVSAWRYIR